MLSVSHAAETRVGASSAELFWADCSVFSLLTFYDLFIRTTSVSAAWDVALKHRVFKDCQVTLIRTDRFMKRFHLTSLLASFVAFFCVSCKEDPKTVEQRAKQKVEIARLSGDIAEVELEIRNLPPDMSADLEKARKTVEGKSIEVMKLEAEVSGLSARRRALQAEFDTWRAKHPSK